jgi:hypothetical protein
MIAVTCLVRLYVSNSGITVLCYIMYMSFARILLSLYLLVLNKCSLPSLLVVILSYMYINSGGGGGRTDT